MYSMVGDQKDLPYSAFAYPCLVIPSIPTYDKKMVEEGYRVTAPFKNVKSVWRMTDNVS